MKQEQRSKALSVLISAVMLLTLTVLQAGAADAKTDIKIGDYIRLGKYNNECFDLIGSYCTWKENMRTYRKLKEC